MASVRSESSAERVVDPPRAAVPAWAVSLVLHVGVLLALALVVVDPPHETLERLVLTQDPFEDPAVLEPMDIAVAEERAETVGAASEQGAEMAEAVAPEVADVAVAPVEAATELVSEIEVRPLDVMPTALTLTKSIVVKGAVSGVGTAGASGAVDRLAAEINGYLEQNRDTVICWLFDQSVSLAAQRKEIAARLERVFDELGVSNGGPRSRKLSHVVAGYGKNVTLITKKPTDDCEEVVKAIRSIEIDESGVEMTFTAIGKAAEGSRVFRNASPRKNVLIIAFTDEVGNDENLADQTARTCQQLGIPVYVVGVPAPFGQRQVKMKFVEPDPEYDQGEQWAVVEQGPETLCPEVVRIHAGRFKDDAIESGFGPFSLSKLCAATQGLYFAVHPSRSTEGRVSDKQVAPMSSRLRHFFDPDVMRDYRPDYRTAAEIDQLIRKNRATQALVEAAKSSEISPVEAPTLTFPRKDDADLVRLLGLAQREAAVLQTKVDAIHDTLAKGAGDRPQIKEKRWQAGYDLAMGRVLALKVRTYAYNSMLGNAKSGMKFSKPDSDTWELVPADDVSGIDSRAQKLAAQARELLERVVAEHPGTPWALLAADELQTPIGFRWEERHTGVNDEKMGAGNNNPNPNPAAPQDDKKKKLAPPKPRRDLKNV
jgi:hypothetical protein